MMLRGQLKIMLTYAKVSYDDDLDKEQVTKTSCDALEPKVDLIQVV